MIGWLQRVEAAFALILGWALVFLLPSRWTAQLFGGVSAPADGPAVGLRDVARARAVARRIERTARRLPWTSTCLVQAIACALLLRRRRIGGARIRLGLRKSGERLEAHAWLLLGSEILLGGAAAEGYAPLADL